MIKQIIINRLKTFKVSLIEFYRWIINKTILTNQSSSQKNGQDWFGVFVFFDLCLQVCYICDLGMNLWLSFGTILRGLWELGRKNACLQSILIRSSSKTYPPRNNCCQYLKRKCRTVSNARWRVGKVAQFSSHEWVNIETLLCFVLV